jgi:hypothetical protein
LTSRNNGNFNNNNINNNGRGGGGIVPLVVSINQPLTRLHMLLPIFLSLCLSHFFPNFLLPSFPFLQNK